MKKQKYIFIAKIVFFLIIAISSVIFIISCVNVFNNSTANIFFKSFITGYFMISILVITFFFLTKDTDNSKEDILKANELKKSYQRLGNYEYSPGADFLEKAAIFYIENHFKKETIAGIKKAKNKFSESRSNINSIYALTIYKNQILKEWNMYEGMRVSFNAYLNENNELKYYPSSQGYFITTLTCVPNLEAPNKIPKFNIFDYDDPRNDELLFYNDVSAFVFYLDDPSAYKQSNDISRKCFEKGLFSPYVTVTGTLDRVTLDTIDCKKEEVLTLRNCSIIEM